MRKRSRVIGAIARRAIREMARNRTIPLSTHLLARGRIGFDGLPAEMLGAGATLEEAFHALTEGGACANAAA
jgi:hypothetical protein